MGKTYDHMPEAVMDFIRKQEVFWVATAPLSGEGHVNVSPKGLRGTFFIEGLNKVWYEDLSGSGCETIAHLRENGRITVMFNAFQGPAEIVRLYGKGSIYEFGSAEYEARLPPENRKPGSRAAIVIDVHRVGTSCGWGVPIYEFKGHRRLLIHFGKQLEGKDIAAQVENGDSTEFENPQYGMKWYWQEKGTTSIDGLSSMQIAPRTRVPIQHTVPGDAAWVDEKEATANGTAASSKLQSVFGLPARANGLVNTLMGFLLGIIASYLFVRFGASLTQLIDRQQGITHAHF